MLLMAASTTEAAMADSVRRAGMATTCSAASDSVSECAAVNAVTVRTTSASAGRIAGTGAQAPSWRRRTAGSSSAIRNST